MPKGMQMEPAVWIDPSDVEAALARLGLTVHPLQKAIVSGYLARISCTANDAPIAPGFYQWNATVRMLREELVMINWTRCDEGNFATIVSPDQKIAIAVASGNEDTGIEHAVPTTRSSKGPNKAAAVVINSGQLDFFLAEATPVDDAYKRATWMLLFHTYGDEIRGEPSLPVQMDEEGHISIWKERIILPATPLGSDVKMPVPDFSPDVEIDIRRRA
jgi:hypothetical protein